MGSNPTKTGFFLHFFPNCPSTGAWMVQSIVETQAYNQFDKNILLSMFHVINLGSRSNRYRTGCAFTSLWPYANSYSNETSHAHVRVFQYKSTKNLYFVEQTKIVFRNYTWNPRSVLHVYPLVIYNGCHIG